MKILIISYYYRPDENPRSFRWSSICEYWVSQGHKVDVICKNNGKGDLDEIINGVNITRLNVFFNSMFKFKKVEKTLIEKNFSIKNLIINLLSLVWKSIYWPDFACLWILKGVKVARRKVNKADYDLVITSSIPFSCHLVGYFCLNRESKKKWIVDIGDPFSIIKVNSINNVYIYKFLNSYAEHRIFKAAKVISVTNKNFLSFYSKKYKTEKNKIIVIPPVVSLKNINLNFKNNDDNKKITFIGTLYKKARNPKILLQWFSQIIKDSNCNNLTLHFYGDINDCEEELMVYKDYLNKRIFIHGIVLRDNISKVLSESSILINIGNNSEYQLPSKLIEYMLNAKPVINFYTSRLDSSVEFLSEFDNVYNLFNYEFEENIKYKEIINFINKNHYFDLKNRELKLEKYSLINIANSYLYLK